LATLIQTQLEIAYEIEYLDNSTFHDLDEKCTVIGKMLGSLIKARS
jgi:four helix bundle protein